MSTDNKPTVQQAAKNGNPQAISILLNRQLQPKGITAKVSVKDSCLQIMLEAANIPNQKALVTAIQKWIDGLGITSIQSVQVYAKQTGEEIPAWNDRFEIAKPLEEPKTANVASVALQTPQTKPIGKETANQVDSALVELAKNGDTKAISELIKNSLQQADMKVRATLSKGLLQVVIVSNKVPKQDKSVEAIPKLVTSFKSILIQKVKVVGMQEIEGSNNSNIFWVQESVIDKQSIQDITNNNNEDDIQDLTQNNFATLEYDNKDNDLVNLDAMWQTNKTNIQQASQILVFKKFYSRINPLLKYIILFASILTTSYCSWILIQSPNEIKKFDSLDRFAKKYYNEEKSSDAPSFENISPNGEYILEIVVARKLQENEKSRKEYFSMLTLTATAVLLFVSILLVCVYMELQLIANAKKLKLDSKEKYQLLKEELRKDPTNTTLRQTALETARLSGYDEQTITNDLSAIQPK